MPSKKSTKKETPARTMQKILYPEDSVSDSNSSDDDESTEESSIYSSDNYSDGEEPVEEVTPPPPPPDDTNPDDPLLEEAMETLKSLPDTMNSPNSKVSWRIPKKSQGDFNESFENSHISSRTEAALIKDLVAKQLPSSDKRYTLTDDSRDHVQEYVRVWRDLQMKHHREVADACKYIVYSVEQSFASRLEVENLTDAFTTVTDLLNWLEKKFHLKGGRDTSKTVAVIVKTHMEEFLKDLGETQNYESATSKFTINLYKVEEQLQASEIEMWQSTLRNGFLQKSLIDMAAQPGRTPLVSQLASRMAANKALEEVTTLKEFTKRIWKYANDYSALTSHMGTVLGISNKEASTYLQSYGKSTKVDKYTKYSDEGKKRKDYSSSAEGKKKPKGETNHSQSTKSSNENGPPKPCSHCGKPHPGECKFMVGDKPHPDVNQDGGEFLSSVVGKKYKQLGKTSLRFEHKLNHAKDGLVAMEGSNYRGTETNYKKYTKKGECIIEKGQSQHEEAYLDPTLLILNGEDASKGGDSSLSDQEKTETTPNGSLDLKSCNLVELDDGLVEAEIEVTNNLTHNIPIKLLIDTGANVYDFCSHRIRDKIRKQGGTIQEVERTVHVGNHKVKCTESISVQLKLFDKVKNCFDTQLYELTVIDIPHDVIVGRKTLLNSFILKQTLCQDILSIHDIDTWVIPLLNRIKRDELPYDKWTEEMTKTAISERLQHLEWEESMFKKTQREETKHRQECKEFQQAFLEKLEQIYPTEIGDESQRQKKRRLNYRNSAKVEDEVKTLLALTKAPQSESSHDDPTLDDTGELPTQLGNDPELREELLKVITRHKGEFSTQLRKEAADLPSMNLTVADAWESAENRRSPRMQGPKRNEEINKQTIVMEDFGVIRLSTASAHSQVLLTPKPDGTWRFCVDYRRLNEQTKAEQWPIPNIPEMLRRIGAKKPRYFGVIDLTKGYYQAPLSESSKHYTAFITSCALYEWNRVPMGLMGAPTYFQRIMTTVVLAGLMYNTCEVYMDDIIVWGSTKKEYIENVSKVLKRLERHRLTANPKKTQLGLESIEYVGHKIDHEKVVFNRERLQKIIEFPEPQTLGQLKKFLGMAGYVRDSVKGAADRTTLLTELFQGYSRKRKNEKIPWRDELRAAFQEVKQGVNESQSLFFLDEKSPVHLYTDASDYGIGAWLVQKIDGKDRTIALMSKTLTKSQKKWHINEKEAYAIVIALQKFEYLIRDVHFTLYTDHANLIYIRDTGSPKVIAWKCKVQEFDFAVKFVSGEDNIVADELSRNPSAEQADEEPDPYTVTDLDKLNLQENEHMAAYMMAMTKAEREVVESVHNAETGHNGVHATMTKLKKAGHKWKHMRADVTKYIKECDTCAKRAHTQIHHDVAPFTTVTTRLMKNRSIDTIGPFKEDVEGNKFLVVMIDTFSRWVEIYKAKDSTAIETAQALYENYGRFGAPDELKSDRGHEFVNQLVEMLNERVGVKHTLSIPYSHEENGVVENANREIRKFISDICYDKRLSKSDWSRDIPSVMRVLNTSPKTMTGMSPAFMLYAGSIDLDNKLFKYNLSDEEIDQMADDATTPWSDWLANRKLAQSVALQHAKKRTIAHQENHMGNDSGKRTEYPIGSLVYKMHAPSNYGSGKPSKQDNNWTGPFRVKYFEGDTYMLVDLINNKTLTPVKVHRLKPYEHDPIYINPMDIRMKDFDDQYEVEEILNHKGRWEKKKSLRFEVKWLGYEETTQEPWKNIRDNQVLHEYLFERGLGKHIPQKFRE